MTFSDQLQDAGAPIFEQVLDHPFLNELAAGTLSRDVFSFYVVQDVIYISEFVKIVSAVAARAPRRVDTAALCRRIGAIAAEHELHEHLAGELDIDDEVITATGAQPTTRAYLDYLTATVQTRGFLEGLGATLACPLVYWHVGRALMEAGSPDRLYQAWIERYGGPIAVDNMPLWFDIADRAGAAAGEQDRAVAAERFVTGCRYEWMFWDAAYRRHTWPV